MHLLSIQSGAALVRSPSVGDIPAHTPYQSVGWLCGPIMAQRSRAQDHRDQLEHFLALHPDALTTRHWPSTGKSNEHLYVGKSRSDSYPRVLDAAGHIDDETMLATLTTNFMGPVRLTSALIEHLKSRPRSVIINNTSVLTFVPLAATAVYSATKAALHSYSLSQRFTLRDTSVTVQEIAPPWVNTDLVHKGDDPRAMPLDAFIEQTMAGLATDTPEVVVEAIRAIRDNPGSNEHALIHGFNLSLVDNPIPVG